MEFDWLAFAARAGWLAVAGGAFFAVAVLVELHRICEGHKGRSIFMLATLIAITALGGLTCFAVARIIG